MPIDREALTVELLRLRKNRAMLAPDLFERLGPHTRQAFGVERTDTYPLIRAKVRARIESLLTDGTERLCTSALAALGLSQGADQRLLTARRNWLAAQLGCDERTSRRRVDAAFQELVAALLEDEHASHVPRPPAQDGFVVRRFQATMRLDTRRPELHERRTILVTADRLDAVLGRLTVPRATSDADHNDVTVTASAGGRVSSTERRPGQHFLFTLELPRPLRYGETHDYGLVISIPAGQLMRPHYVFQPLVACETFDLTVRFDPANLPENIWWVDGAPPRELDDEPTGAPVRTAATGTVERSFTGLRQGLSYGLRWWPGVSVRQ